MGKASKKTRKSADKKKSEDNVSKQNPSPSLKDEDREESLWLTFNQHPLVRSAFFLGLPYSLFMLYLILSLQHPEWVEKASLGFFKMRPTVRAKDMRQVLIVGNSGSDTYSTKFDLGKDLGLEIGHENSNSEWEFVRDGTVSWVHGMRFFPTPINSTHISSSFEDLCGMTRTANGMSFNMDIFHHPTKFRPTQNGCLGEYRKSQCWAKDCLVLLRKEWGCELRGTCETPYKKTLHQTRNPMRSIETLVKKYCNGDPGGNMDEKFLRTYKAFFDPQPSIHTEFGYDSCIEVMAKYVLNYETMMMDAKDKGFIDSIYRVEDVGPCDIAELSGLISHEEAVYKPNHYKFLSSCSGTKLATVKSMGRSKQKGDGEEGENEMTRFGFEDLLGGAHGGMAPMKDASLQNNIKDLFGKLGYDASLEEKL